ncbi:MAG: hypothetical protein J5825_07630 [Lachnospiraceae bacterium]|nr:hypothetical protein [Lachnospiraceae bacterium]
MDYSEYLNRTLSMLRSLDTDYEFTTRQVIKNNDTCLDALMARLPDQNIVPTLYFQDLYEEFRRIYGGDPLFIQDQCERILKRIDPVLHPIPDCYQLDFSDFEGLKDRIVCRIINRETNRMLLGDVPHRDYLDLSIIYYILLRTPEENGHDFATALIHNKNMDSWGVTEEELYELATENTPLLLPAKLQNIENMIDEIFGREKCHDTSLNEPADEDPLFFEDPNDPNGENDPELRQFCRDAVSACPMYVLSNPKRLYGAVAILYPGLLEECLAKLGCGFFVLPSSVHETILVPSAPVCTPNPRRSNPSAPWCIRSTGKM